MLSVNNITFSYRRKQKPTLSDFSLRLASGGVYGLLGSNGAGKSTLLYLISGLLTPEKGDVTFNGINTRLRLPSVSSEIFLVPEETILPALKLSQYVKINAPFYPRFSSEDMKRHLATFGMEDDLQLDQLSMGQKKKVFLCFAMACNTKVLLMDEPTNGLDIPSKSAFRRFIAREMNDERIFIISTHQVRDVSQILDHILIIEKSHVLFNRPVAEIQQRLRFIDTTDKELISDALYTVKGLGGASVVLPNESDEELEMNLELLFDFAINNPEKLNSKFTTLS